MSKNKLELIIEAVDRFTGPFRKIGKSVAQFSKRSGLQAVGTAAMRAGKGIRSLAAEAVKLGGIVGVAVGGLFALTRATAAFGDNLAKTADRLGLNITWLQKYRYAANLSDVATGTFDMAMQRFTRRAAEAAAGTGVAKDALKRLGVELRDGQGKMKSSEKLLNEVADGMKKVEDPAVRVRLAFALFDSEGVKMVNMLKNGSAAMNAAANEAEKLGIMTEAQARASEKFNDNMTKLWRAIKQLGYSIGSELMPYMEEFVVAMKDMVLEAKPEIIEGLRKAIKYLRDDLPKTITGIFALASPFISLAGWLDILITNTIGWKKAVWILAGILGGNLLKAIVMTTISLGAFVKAVLVAAFNLTMMAASAVRAMITGLISMAPALLAAVSATWAWTAALLANPLTWIVIAIAAAAGAVWLIVKNWDQVSAKLSAIWDGIRQAFSEGFLNGIIHLLKNFAPIVFIAEAVNKLISYLFGIDLFSIGQDWIQGFGDGIQSQWQKITAWLSSAVDELLALIPDWAKDKLGISANVSSVNVQNSGLTKAPSALPAAANGNMNGRVRVSFENAPAGMRVREVATDNSSMALDVDAGLAMGGI